VANLRPARPRWFSYSCSCLLAETTSSNVDGSLLMAEHNFWSEGGRSAEDAQLFRGSLPHISAGEVDGSNSSTASQVAVHAPMATSTGTTAKEVPSDQEISETGALHDQNSRLDAGGSSSQTGWASLTPRILSKVLRLLRGDPKSLAAAMATCQLWKDCAQNIKVSIKHVDLSGLGSHCNDAILDGLLVRFLSEALELWGFFLGASVNFVLLLADMDIFIHIPLSHLVL
jgi:hypothetical protein